MDEHPTVVLPSRSYCHENCHEQSDSRLFLGCAMLRHRRVTAHWLYGKKIEVANLQQQVVNLIIVLYLADLFKIG